MHADVCVSVCLCVCVCVCVCVFVLVVSVERTLYRAGKWVISSKLHGNNQIPWLASTASFKVFSRVSNSLIKHQSKNSLHWLQTNPTGTNHFHCRQSSKVEITGIEVNFQKQTFERLTYQKLFFHILWCTTHVPNCYLWYQEPLQLQRDISVASEEEHPFGLHSITKRCHVHLILSYFNLCVTASLRQLIITSWPPLNGSNRRMHFLIKVTGPQDSHQLIISSVFILASLLLSWRPKTKKRFTLKQTTNC